MREIKSGEIWWVELSYKDRNTTGHETKKNRPWLLIANCKEAKMGTGIPFQSNLRALNLPFTHLVRKTQKNKLNKDSVAVIFQIRSLDYGRFLNMVGTIDINDFKKIKILMREFFAF